MLPPTSAKPTEANVNPHLMARLALAEPTPTSDYDVLVVGCWHRRRGRRRSSSATWAFASLLVEKEACFGGRMILLRKRSSRISTR